MGRKTDKYKNEQKMQRGITGVGWGGGGVIRENEEGSGEGQRRREVVRKGGLVKEWTRGVGWRMIFKGINEGSGKGMGEERESGNGQV